MEEVPSKVLLHVYDLSQGLARQLSPLLLGKQIDGIWHTGIVVHGREYYYGMGIQWDSVGQTPYGIPYATVDLGETAIPQSIFIEEFLEGLRSRFRVEDYHLLHHNCNTFTSECALFLTGHEIPSYVSSLPAEIMNTPLGAMIQPWIEALHASALGHATPFDRSSGEGSSHPHAPP